MRLPEKFLDEVIARNDIVDVVSEYVHLTPQGANYFGLCPFHSEKTPSFSVSRSKQIYHCFGCSKGGGVISFVMDVENITFLEAVEKLAARVGLQMPHVEYDPKDRRRPSFWSCFVLRQDFTMRLYTVNEMEPLPVNI